MKNLLYFVSILLPWPLRRRVLKWVFRFDLHPTSRIGLSWIRPQKLVMGPYAKIGHLNFCKGLTLLQMGKRATIGRGNWITGFPRDGEKHFGHQTDRQPVLIVGDDSAITNRHLIDCTNTVTIGRFSTLAGFQSQVLTHSIDLVASRQSSQPVEIGDYCFIGTNVVILGGAALPSYSILGAKSLLNKRFSATYTLYGGVPVVPIKTLSEDIGYFHRETGFVV